MVELKNIGKSFGPRAILQNLSLKIEEGELFTLLGESGSGKTTLLRLIAGFEEPDEGEILIAGEDILSLPVEMRPVGFIFQNYALFPHLSVFDNIATGPRVRGLPLKEIKLQVNRILEVLRLEDLRHAFPCQLSGGESQRVAIARAVVNQPRILLLDEPFSALDPTLRRSLREEMADMRRDLGATFLMVTHDQEEALSLSSRIGVLKDGKLQQTGTPADLYQRPANGYIAEFLGRVNRLEGKVDHQSGSRLWVDVDYVGRLTCQSKIERAPGSPVTLFIRPEHTFISFKKSAGPSDNEVHGLLIKCAYYGTHTEYQVALKNGEIFHVRVQQGTHEENPPPGRHVPVSLLLPPSHLFWAEENGASGSGDNGL